MFASSKTASSGGPPDAQFNYVTMLLHGDGTNGAQNNTFVDSSTNNFTITRNGNTTQGSFSPYGSNWSNYFDGSGDYLATSSTQIIPASSTYTVEAWVYLTGDYSDYREIVTQGSSGNANRWLMFVNITDGILKFQTGSSSITTSFTVPKNTWTHLAFVNNGGSYTVYANGTSVGSGSISVTPQNTYLTVGAFQSGAEYFQGYISNVRITNTAVYTSAFTPSTTPLTAISGTSFLTCQSNRFIDNSANTYAITAYGNSSVQRFSPFANATAYNPATLGGSAYFDGSGDYLSVANSAPLQLLGGSFTLECWIYLTAAQTNMGIVGIHDNSSTGYFIRLDTTIIRFYTSAATVDRTYSFAQNTWYHIAVSSSGTTGTLYINGVAQGATFSTNGTQDTTDPFLVGRTTTLTNYFSGYISDVRVVKGTALYTGTFTPPTAPLTAVTNTQLLLSTTNAGILDNAMMNDLETVGNAQISTSVVKYGTGSLAFDGTGDYLFVPTNQNMNFGSGNFTIEMWIYPVNVSSIPYLIDGRSTSTASENVVTLYVSSSQYLTYWVNGSARITASSTVSLNTWSHVAVVKNSGTTTMYLNGTSVGTWTDGTTYIASSYLIGQRTATSSQSWNGYIDDLRITKGYARYTANFTSPTEAFPNIGPT